MSQVLREELQKRQDWLEKLIKDKEKSLRKAPEGRFRFNVHGNRVQYYHRTDPKDTSGKYIRNEDRKLAEALAQRDYDNQILKLAQREAAVIKNLRSIQEERAIEEIYESLKQPRRNLVIPDAISDE